MSSIHRDRRDPQRVIGMLLPGCVALLSACSGGGGVGDDTTSRTYPPDSSAYACPANGTVGKPGYFEALNVAVLTAQTPRYLAEWCGKQFPLLKPAMNRNVRKWRVDQKVKELEKRTERVLTHKDWRTIHYNLDGPRKEEYFASLASRNLDAAEVCQSLATGVDNYFNLDQTDPEQARIIAETPTYTPSLVAGNLHLGIKADELDKELRPMGGVAPYSMGGPLRSGTYYCKKRGWAEYDMVIYPDQGMRMTRFKNDPRLSWDLPADYPDAKSLFTYTEPDGAIEVAGTEMVPDGGHVADYVPTMNLWSNNEVFTTFRQYTDAQCRTFLYGFTQDKTVTCAYMGGVIDQSPTAEVTAELAKKRLLHVEPGKGITNDMVAGAVDGGPDILLRDGTVYRSPKFAIDELDINKSKIEQADQWTQWRVGAGGAPEILYSGKWIKNDKLVRPLPARFQAKYSRTSGGSTGYGSSYSTTAYHFEPNGRWSLHYSGASYSESPFASYSEGSDGANAAATGNYTVSGYNIVLEYDGEDRVDRWVAFYPEAGDRSISLDGGTYYWDYRK